MNRQTMLYMGYLVQQLEHSISHFDKDLRSALDILARQVVTYRFLIFATFVLGRFVAIFEESSVGILGLTATVDSGEGAFQIVFVPLR